MLFRSTLGQTVLQIIKDVLPLFGSKTDFRFGRLNLTIGLGNGIDSSSEVVDFFALHLHNFDVLPNKCIVLYLAKSKFYSRIYTKQLV